MLYIMFVYSIYICNTFQCIICIYICCVYLDDLSGEVAIVDQPHPHVIYRDREGVEQVLGERL